MEMRNPGSVLGLLDTRGGGDLRLVTLSHRHLRLKGVAVAEFHNQLREETLGNRDMRLRGVPVD
jgi:hypothetical protein